ncbi:MAG: hypothetical protein HDT18_04575 [Oscillibacter sp.]|nr:hypothetical protein [Oscillibacter sp.]
MGEFLYSVLADQMELRTSFYSLEYLPKLIEKYHEQHPDCTLTAEKLLSEGWLSPFLDRWDFSIWPHLDDLEERTIPDKRREYVDFLCWLMNRQKDYHEIFVPQFTKILRRFRRMFPQMPTRKWFVQEGFLSPDGLYLSRGRRNRLGAAAGALARLWSRQPGPQDADRADQWLDLAMALGAMHGAFDRLPCEQQQFLLERVVIRLEAGRYPDISAENQRIRLAETWRRAPGAIDSNWQPLSGDLILDLKTFDRSGWDWNRTLLQRDRIVHSYLWVLCSHLELLNRELLDRAADIILRLSEIGCLSGFSIPAESIICLWHSPKTSLLACEQMIFHSVRKSKLHDELFTEALHQITENILFGYFRPPADGTEWALLLLFFAEQPPGGRVGELGSKALAQLLTELRYRRQELKSQLKSIARELERRMARTNDTLDWCRCFRLTCLLIQELYYYRGGIPAVREDSACQTMREVLFTQYLRLFQHDIEFLESAPGLLDIACFSYDFWNDIYQERKKSLQKLGAFLQPEIPPESTSSSRVDSYYKCEIHLAVLTVLMKSREGSDQILEQIFAEFLSHILLPEHGLLDYDTIAMTNAQPLVETAVSLVRTDQDCFDRFLQDMKQYGLPELVLICHAAQDDRVKERCLEFIQAKIKADGQLPSLLARNPLVHLILEAQIECLYPAAEQILTQQMKRWEKYPSAVFRKEARQTTGQLNLVWRQQKEYGKILEQGDPFYRAIAYMESEEHRDLQKAEFIWERLLLEDRPQPSCFINLIYTYSLQYHQEAQRGIEGKSRLQGILAQADRLRERVENGDYSTWTEDEKNQYAINLYDLYRQSATDQHKLIQSLHAALGVDTALFEELNRRELEAAPTEPVEIPSESPVPALRTYCTALLDQKAEWFFQLRSCGPITNPRKALLLWCVMKTCSHLMAYGPQLIFRNCLLEDRCTQLFRELFNQACPEMFTLAANDQEQSGQTAHQGKYGQRGIAEVDLTFKHHDTIVSIGEALRLYHMDKTQVRKHINKLLGNNNLDVPMFLLVYGKTVDPDTLWQEYCAYVCDEFTCTFNNQYWGPSMVKPFSACEEYVPGLHDSYYFHRRMLRMDFGAQERRRPPMYHIFLSIGNDENVPVAIDARK